MWLCLNSTIGEAHFQQFPSIERRRRRRWWWRRGLQLTSATCAINGLQQKLPQCSSMQFSKNRQTDWRTARPGDRLQTIEDRIDSLSNDILYLPQKLSLCGFTSWVVVDDDDDDDDSDKNEQNVLLPFVYHPPSFAPCVWLFFKRLQQMSLSLKLCECTHLIMVKNGCS